jgi:hypothetical protein
MLSNCTALECVKLKNVIVVEMMGLFASQHATPDVRCPWRFQACV